MRLERRAEDRLVPWFFLAGLLFMGGALALKFFRPGTADWLVLALAVLGAALLPTDRILRLVRIWRWRRNNRNGGSDATAG